jgi:4-hydroxybenzoate polyprenyltransferase
VTPAGALAWGVAQSLLAFLVLLSFGFPTIWWGVASLGLVAVYPFAKRFTWWPQAFLGLAFNWGALLLWVAKTDGIAVAPVLLYLAGIMWTLHYDTIYAHQDREDDALIGVKSTARLFEDETEPVLWLFAGAAASLAALAVVTAHGGLIGLLGVAAFGAHLAWQIRTLDIDDPARCLALFRSNRTAGLLLLAGLVAESAL